MISKIGILIYPLLWSRKSLIKPLQKSYKTLTKVLFHFSKSKYS